MDNKMLLILERSSANLSVDKKSGEYILEGVFAQFGVENNNKRIYEEKEYLPHLEYLKKKIATNRLMGELDHPDKFEISLDKVSHIIESLEYDQANRQVKGRVRVLDTPAGKIARSLIDSGVPISISSRAAGSVNEDKKVSIRRIFTFDLVADPGFEDAQLERINESFGLTNESTVQIFDASSWSSPFMTESEDTKTNKQFNMENKEYVSVDDMNKYSKAVKESFAHLEQLIRDNVGANSEIKALKEEIARLDEEILNNRGYAEHIHETVNSSIDHTDHLAETINLSIDYAQNELATSIESVGKWVNEEIVENLNTVSEYLNEEIVPTIQNKIKHADHLVETINILEGYIKSEVGPTLEHSIGFSNELAGEIEKNRAYTEFIANEAVAETEFDALVEYTELAFKDSINEGSTKLAAVGKTNKMKKINESSLFDIEEKPSHEPVKLANRANEITSKIDEALSQIKKDKQEAVNELEAYPAIKLVNENNLSEFKKLDKTKKDEVNKFLLESKSFDKSVLNDVFEKYQRGELNETVIETEPKWITDAPENYKAIYESLSDAKKQKLATQAEWRDGKLETAYQIKNFWETRGLNESMIAPSESEILNESNKTSVIKQTGTNGAVMNGYQSDQVKAVAARLAKMNK